KLRALDIENGNRHGGDFGARKIAQTVKRREPKIVPYAALRAWPKACIASKRSKRQFCLACETCKARQGAKSFRRDNLGRIESRNLGFKRILTGGGDHKRAG